MKECIEVGNQDGSVGGHDDGVGDGDGGVGGEQPDGVGGEVHTRSTPGDAGGFLLRKPELTKTG